MLYRGPGELVIDIIVNNGFNSKYIRGDIPDINKYVANRETLYNAFPHLRDSPIKRFVTMRCCPFNCHYCHNDILHKTYSDQKKNLFKKVDVDIGDVYYNAAK